jgi:hypothetical protein
MKKQLLLYSFLCVANVFFAQEFKKGEIQLGLKRASMDDYSALSFLGENILPILKRNTILAEYHINETASLYAGIDVIPQKNLLFSVSGFIPQGTVVSTYRGTSIGGRWFSTGLYNSKLFLVGDFNYHHTRIKRTATDDRDKDNRSIATEDLRFAGLAMGFSFRPSKYFCVDVNLFRIGLKEKTSVIEPFPNSFPFNFTTIIRTKENGVLLGIPFFASNFESLSLRLSVIIPTSKHE